MQDLLARYKDSENSVYANAASYMDGLGDFFTAGVKKVVQERTLTPRKEKPLSPGTPMKKHQMSNKSVCQGLLFLSINLKNFTIFKLFNMKLILLIES